MRPRKPPQPKTHSFTDEQIRAKAYEHWQKHPERTEEENWNAAIKALKEEQPISAKAQQLWEARLLKLRESDKRTAEDDWRDAQARVQESRWTQFIRWTGIQEKKGWEVVQLLVGISIPIVLFVGGQYFTTQNNDKQQKLADDKAKQDTLVKYLDQMADSLQHGLLKANPGDDQFVVAQSRTVLTLQSLDKNRQHLVIQFLQAAGLNKVDEHTNSDQDGKIQLKKGDKVLLYQAQMSKANLANSDLSGSVLIGINLEQANLGCHPRESKDPGQCSDLSGADLRNAELSNADLRNINLRNANLRKAHLRGADLRNAEFSFAEFSFAELSKADLRDAHLSKVDLRNADLRDAHLSKADLIDADLRNAHLSSAHLRDAELSGADLSYADLSYADLSYADLNLADLSYADLSYADLRNADLIGANLTGAILLNTDLSNAKNFDPTQLKSEPLLCNVALPEGFKDKDKLKNRDCKKLKELGYSVDAPK